jgi:hypothetical protein
MHQMQKNPEGTSWVFSSLPFLEMKKAMVLVHG